MRVPSDNGKFFVVYAAVLVFGLMLQPVPTFAQTQPERFWLAGRYDGNRVIVYFDAVKFNGTVPSNAQKLAPPVAERFFDPVELPASYIAQFQKGPNAEHFALGGKYDLLPGLGGAIVTITLITLLGSEGDEGVGNDPFIGALATVRDEDEGYLPMKAHYVVRRHQESQNSGSNPGSKIRTVYAGLQDESVRFDIQTRIVALLNDRMKTMTTDAERPSGRTFSPAFKVQSFRVADGILRYYARAEWKAVKGPPGAPTLALGAWIAPSPTLHILAVETRTSGYDDFEGELPNLLNVVDLGGSRTGIIVGISGEDSGSLDLMEYRDGVDLRHMRSLQSIGAGE